MVAVERVHEYANIEPEVNSGENPDLPSDWPSEGIVRAQNASFKYHDFLPYVLQRVNFSIKPTEKVSNFNTHFLKSDNKKVAKSLLYK